ncbi:C-type lectin domain family 2 member D6-like isoform X2 [Chrysemys picta bellii]|uniref:C-type lectin domain family 2 member D6-like isoform X2 n=1 Tax=Chrysemys picta bellii TaxID=8478 RepID=UPI0032B1A268
MDPESQRAAASEIELLGVQHAPQGLQERGETEERFDCSGGAERGPGSNHTLRKWASRQVLVPAVVLAAVTVFMLITIITIAALAELLRVEKSKPPVAAPGPPAGPCCPEDWIGYRGKCYYFSETDGNWTYSQSQCSALNASLAAIDSEQEKVQQKKSTRGSFAIAREELLYDCRWRISCCAIRASSTVGSASRGSQASPGDGPTAPNSTTGFQ